MTVLHGIDEGKGYFAFFQVTERWFAELFTGSGEIEEVVNELKGKASVPAVVVEGLFLLLVEAAKHCAETRATAKETGSLVGGEFDGVVFGNIHAANLGQLD